MRIKNYPFFFTVLFFIVVLAIPFRGLSQEERAQKNEKLENAIWLYQHENYEEALEILKELREKEPQSSMIAYYLGITYKQLQDFQAARPHLEAAVTLTPKVKNALLELVDLLYQCDEIDEAKKWIDVAEKEYISPAQTAFFKGLTLLKEGKSPDKAIESFDQAAKLDPAFAQTVEYYKAFAHMQSKRLSEARDIFQKIVTREPTTDLAAFANEYIDAISRRVEVERPFRASAAFAVHYDDNVILRPNDPTLASGVGSQRDWRYVYTVQGDYQYKPLDWFGTRAGYSFYYGKQHDLGFYDMMSNDLSLVPAVYLERAAITFPAHYNHVIVNDKKYLQLVGVGNVDNVTIARDQMVQFSLQYNWKDYAWGENAHDEIRDANEYLWSLGWYYFFAKNREGVVNVRYAMNYEEAKGTNWIYFGNRVSAGSTIPLAKKVNLSVSGDWFAQHYIKGNSIYEKRRFDNVFTVSNLLAVEIFKNAELQFQYTYVNNLSTIGIYKYVRNVYGAGVRYKF